MTVPSERPTSPPSTASEDVEWGVRWWDGRVDVYLAESVARETVAEWARLDAWCVKHEGRSPDVEPRAVLVSRPVGVWTAAA